MGPMIQYDPWEVYVNAEEAKLKWKEIKTIVNKKSHCTETENLINSDKGKILKQFKRTWCADYTNKDNKAT